MATDRLGDHKLEAELVSEIADRPGVLLQVTRGVALVGSVKDADGVLGDSDLGNLLPLLLGGVDARGVVGDSVEHKGGSLGGTVEVLEETVDVESHLLGEVAVLARLETGLAEDGKVVAPRGVGAVDDGVGVVHLEELGSNAESASAREGLDDRDALLLEGLGVLSEDDLGSQVEEGLVALDGKVLEINLASLELGIDHLVGLDERKAGWGEEGGMDGWMDGGREGGKMEKR